MLLNNHGTMGHHDVHVCPKQGNSYLFRAIDKLQSKGVQKYVRFGN
jgi:hypothetical protein